MMNEGTDNLTWTEANQAFLAAEFTRLKQRLQSGPAGGAGEPREQLESGMEPPPAIDRLAEIMGLSVFERELLLLCAGIEMDSELAGLCGAAQGLSPRAPATFGLALGALAEPHWSALTPARPLRRLRLLEVESANRGLVAAPLRIDERVLHYLAGVNALDQRLQGLFHAVPPPKGMAEEHRQAVIRVVQGIDGNLAELPVFHLCGDDGQGQEDIAALAVAQLRLHLFAVRADDLPAVGPDLEELNILWQRESVLLPAALLIQGGSGDMGPAARYLAERLRGVIFVGSREPIRLNRPCRRLDVDKPRPREQKRLWEVALGTKAASLNGSLDAVAEHFRLSARAISSTSTLVGGNSGSVEPKELWNACRSLSRPRLEDLARRVDARAEWDDLVLPDVQKATLQQIAAQVRHRLKVYETWGFAAKGSRGLGVSALFSGESGTGKTMAAEVLARELELDLYRIDLSAVVSKYIGETEKNLKQVFDAAEEGGVILLFDEADALFGKRSEVKDSRDRYANIEVSYLLQRIEGYHGLAILTTNLKATMDRAFQRRIRFSVNFPFPDPTQREALWSRAFPAQTPTRGLEPGKLAQMNVAGGNIRNIALNAAFLAVESGGPVEMGHVLKAAQIEAQKIERPLSLAEVRGWV